MIPFEGLVWRLVPAGANPTRPVTSPEGRFHHSGQSAIYTSLTAEGTAIAIRRYLRPEDPPRSLHALTIRAEALEDLRGRQDASVVWQDERAAGRAAPTWEFSDRARASGAQGMLYSSRSRPDLTHLVLFGESARLILAVGPALPFPFAR